MKEDITPSLIESVNKAFEDNYNSSPTIAKLLKKGKKATYKDAYRYAEQVGNARALAFTEQISSDVLPDGRMYYNIASRLMEDTLGSDQQMITEYAATAQQNVNKQGGINLKAQKADLNQERIDGFVNRLSSEENFDAVAWILQEPVRTYARTVVDDTVYSDSSYVVNAVTEGWLEQWKRTGFKKKKNADLWLRYDAVARRHRIAFHWIKGHAGHPENERCDALAVAARSLPSLPEDEGYLNETKTDTLL